MALSAKLQLRQSQSLVMTPQLMQSIRLLQFTQAELEQFIEQEIERNPLIERADSADEAPAEAVGSPAFEADSDGSGDWYETGAVPSAEAMAERFDTSMENVFPDEPGATEQISPSLGENWKSAGKGATSAQAGSDGFNFEDVASAKITLRDHVAEQIAFTFSNAADRLIALELADELDETGYFRGDTADIAVRLGVRRHEAEQVLTECQTFEPTGLLLATWRNAYPYSLPPAIGWTRRCACWLPIWGCWRGGTLPHCASFAGWTTRICSIWRRRSGRSILALARSSRRALPTRSFQTS
jgi:RNA polymerase sigma-54 factor